MLQPAVAVHLAAGFAVAWGSSTIGAWRVRRGNGGRQSAPIVSRVEDSEKKKKKKNARARERHARRVDAEKKKGRIERPLEGQSIVPQYTHTLHSGPPPPSYRLQLSQQSSQLSCLLFGPHCSASPQYSVRSATLQLSSRTPSSRPPPPSEIAASRCAALRPASTDGAAPAEPAAAKLASPSQRMPSPPAIDPRMTEADDATVYGKTTM